ncbi:PAS domain S-box-containing protein [Bacillus ectoiniformans]|uniref:sigma 54-interacting transcriptional regulator n=1 Tax=Bacillus ectoiniformans TaxID=1494429 RepID=UPI0019591B28|nr:sigma 54-interacting transcriptional regulator [Bacillus ectoiniformans]MBM7650111.1 PAS domain S-box-containing protein [Bacillus ectoiniformans]
MTIYKQLALITGSIQTKEQLHQQLVQIFGEYIKIESYAVDESVPLSFTNKMIVYSSHAVKDETTNLHITGCREIISKRTANYDYIDQLFLLKKNTKVLYVNDSFESAAEAIDNLLHLGMDHLEYIPYSKSLPVPFQIDAAVTPGENELVPSFITHTINLGVRLIDIHTIIQIADFFQLPEATVTSVTNRYLKKIIDLSQKLSSISQKAKSLNHFLEKVVDGVNDGILAFTANGQITVFNEGLSRMTGWSADQAIGKELTRIFKDEKMAEFLLYGQEEGNQYFSFAHSNAMVSRFYLKDEKTIVATFKDVDETIKMEKLRHTDLQKKGYLSKYSFHDIIGNSSILETTKKTAGKLAAVEWPILIFGETGTGKELFAGAIHQASPRKDKAFVAVNCSALSEDLLESELFGYEEGSFTGAKKGGKKGLFEQADGGTLFLDEIGDISSKLQARLLRVLEEMEVRRIGGDKHIPINVRIIAATNKDLHAKTMDGSFRADLYHRLKVLYLQLPSLTERKEDIPLLIRHYLNEMNKQDLVLLPETFRLLMDYHWPGNVRELKNMIQYVVTVADDQVLPGHLPIQLQTEETPVLSDKKREWVSLLQIISKGNAERQSVGRKSLSAQLPPTCKLTEQQIRTRLKELQSLGYIVIYKGRRGSQMTSAGEKFLSENIHAVTLHD